MAATLRVIPCLDVSAGRVVKGVHFENLADAGDPVELAARYGADGADELTFLDVSASVEDRGTTMDVVTRTAEQVFIPLTVGGGIRSVDDVARLLAAGADKVSVNTAALARPTLLTEIAREFGSQVLVLSVDARRVKNSESAPVQYEVTTHGGRRSGGVDALAWVKDAVDRGVGEILLNSMDHDGTTKGFDLEMTATVREICSVPLIASGGAGTVDDFVDVAKIGVDAVLAASVFHHGTLTIAQVKDGLTEEGILVR